MQLEAGDLIKIFKMKYLYCIIFFLIFTFFVILNFNFDLLYYLTSTRYNSYNSAVENGYMKDDFVSSKSELYSGNQVKIGDERFIIFNYGNDGFNVVNIPKIGNKYIWYRKNIYLGGEDVSFDVETFYSNKNFRIIISQNKNDLKNKIKAFNVIESSKIFEIDSTFYSLVEI